MEKMVGFVKLYFAVFLIGAVFGKVIELSGFSESIVHAAIRYIGRSRANAMIVTGIVKLSGTSEVIVKCIGILIKMWRPRQSIAATLPAAR